MKIYGQRWRFQLANTEVHIDNAFSWFGWAQERVLINGELAHSAGGWLVFKRSFKEPWLTFTGDGELSIKMFSTALGVEVKVELEGKALEYEELYEVNWNGRGRWPDEAAWNKVNKFSIFG